MTPRDRARSPMRALADQGAVPHDERAHGHTGGHVATPALKAHDDPLVAAISRVATRFRAAAQDLEELAELAQARLAAAADPSVHRDPVKPTLPSDRAMLTQGEVAELLGYDPRTVRRLELKGDLPPAIGKGRLKRWRVKDLERHLAGLRPTDRRGPRG